jgi:hypothetical protein
VKTPHFRSNATTSRQGVQLERCGMIALLRADIGGQGNNLPLPASTLKNASRQEV